MAWDFSTEPEFQKKLDWVERFCREQVEPLDLVFPYAVRSKDPKLKALVKDYKATVLKNLGKPFPDDPMEQLMGAVSAVFSSWNGRRAVEYRRIERIPDEWGTAVNVQAMVFGNMGNDSATKRPAFIDSNTVSSVAEFLEAAA